MLSCAWTVVVLFLYLYPSRGQLVLEFPDGPGNPSTIPGASATLISGSAPSTPWDAQRGTVTTCSSAGSTKFDVVGFRGVPITGAFTAMMWYKPSSITGTSQYLLVWGKSAALTQPVFFLANGKPAFGYWNHDFHGTDLGPMTAGTWYHVGAGKAADSTGASTVVFLGGTKTGLSHSAATLVDDLTMDFQIYIWDTSSMTDLRLFSQLLSDAEIAAFANGASSLGAIYGDPHFISFAGGTYEVRGKAGNMYNIISTRTFQWNALFTLHPRNQTKIGLSGFRVLNHTIIARMPFEVFSEWIGQRAVPTNNKHAYFIRCIRGRRHTARAMPTGYNGENIIDGHPDQYVVSTLHGTDFAYNQFHFD